MPVWGWVLLGCGGLVLLFFFAMAVAVPTLVVPKIEAQVDRVQVGILVESEVRASAKAQELLGGPLSRVDWSSENAGAMEFSDDGDRAEGRLEVHGPEATCVLEYVAIQADDEWELERVLLVGDTEALDLLGDGVGPGD